MIGEGKVVCVTGASGYIASWLVKILLDRGYSVHATVRSLDDPKKTEHLLALDGAKERLSLFEANLTEEGSFESAVNGCECLFHTASPVILEVDDPQAQLLDPAVKGTINALKSAAKVPSLKRVILTSSMAAVMFSGKLLEDGVVVDETWFSDPLICEQKKLWYALSKTLAEDAATKFSKDNGLELVVINPGYVIGPFLQPTLNLTSEGILSLIKTGKEVFPDGIYRLVDVRDIANAHILAFENPKANGRYCLVGAVTRSSEIMKILNKLYPALGHSERYGDGKCVAPIPYDVSRARAESLGVDFTRIEMIGEGKAVCVTGASGYIASWLVKILLRRGYSVHATVRSLDDPKKTERLLALDGAKERLSLFEANLTEEGSFESALNGCECLFHTASPVVFSVDNAKAQLLDPAVKGTLNVLKSAAKVPSLKRVVLTSSMASVTHSGKPLEDDVVVDETWFSDPQICEQKKLWYNLSKTLAEDAAAKFSKENGLELVTINPGYVIGPILHPTLNLTSEEFMSFIKTGASGYIASWLVKSLLDRGYSVHSTVRSLHDPKKTEYLLALDGAKERLSLFEANLTEEGSFESAVNGCECLFHTASPVIFSVDNAKAQLLDPAVKGTLNVLKSAAKVPSLKRVVLTSSMAAVIHNGKPLEDDVEVDETWFSDPQICEQKKLWYALSKTLAEDAATKFSKENGLELVIINPGYVIGPILHPTLNLTSEEFMSFIKTGNCLPQLRGRLLEHLPGKEISPSPDGIYRLVDVRDVASAHILAFENPKANGRYCMVGDVIRSSEITYIINKLYPALHPSERCEDGKCFAPVPFDVSREKAESLGVEFTPIGVSIKDTVDSLKEKKLLTF
ncbi:hypothetical protein OSB04_009078 [Centaurea solstitialis]|uniref:Dihydroflavonol 4-reductase n=1 Tax=Centaurea solstitialis TaxID=347529 RepID=A0AA38U7H9_9ASTR|nr:hypothetical protein OSB04_009078 [Centaurea solstitialis]